MPSMCLVDASKQTNLSSSLAADYNQSMTSPGALRKRLLKYVIPVIAFSVAFNVPKFFEAKIVVSRARDS